MYYVLNIARKDLLQLFRSRIVFLFLLIMPVVMTLLLGFAFGAFDKTGDPRLPVGLLDQDQSWVSARLIEQLEKSELIKLDKTGSLTPDELGVLVADGDLAAALVIPSGYGRSLSHGHPIRLELVAETDLPAGMSVESEVLTAVLRVDSAMRAALLLEQAASRPIPFEYSFDQVIEAWEDPPIQVEQIKSQVLLDAGASNQAFANINPGFMLQFAIASLLVSAQIFVDERKTRSLGRLLTTAVPRRSILLGHYLAVLLPIVLQFLILLSFGQLLLGVNYAREPLAVLIVALASAVCIAALGLLIGVFAKTEEQAVIFSLVPMFLLAILGGAWVPLEVVGGAFQVFGHVSPIAWALDGFKNISVRGLGIESILLPVAALVGYAVLFYVLASWKFSRLQEA